MKKSMGLLLSLFLLPFFLIAQQFELAKNPVTSKLSDSRSANFLDLNNDGWEDIFLSNGLEGGQKDMLYLNDGTGNFIEVSGMDIVEAVNPADGASFADYNNDGFIDGVVSSWYGAKDLLYLNDGSGQLKYNPNSGIVERSFGETAAFGDYDGDGWLDLLITNSGGGQVNYLYKNLKNGKFELIATHLLLEEAKPSRGAIWGDFNNDGLTDLFVANESNQSNDLYFGVGAGAFEQWNLGSIVARNNSTMTGSWGDIDNDGDFDLFVGNSGAFVGAKNELILNTGNRFMEILDSPIQADQKCTFGSAFGDYDNDGDLDLIITNGFCRTNMRNQLFENLGGGNFKEVSDQLASNFNTCSFGVAWGDVNNDGFLDLLVANCKNGNSDTEKRNTLLMNKGNDNNWLSLSLKGVKSNRSAIGTKVRVKATIDSVDVWQIREIRSQSGYAGQNSLVAHFGLGEASIVDSLQILWSSGLVEILEQVSVNQRMDLLEGVITSVDPKEPQPNLTVRLFPNPLKSGGDTIQVQVNNPMGSVQAIIQLYNNTGALLWKKDLTLHGGMNELTLDKLPHELSPGIHYLNLETEKNRIGQKILIQ